LSDSTAVSWTRQLHQEASIKTSKVIHIGRESGARLIEANSVPEDQIRCGSHWNTNQITGYYLITLPQAFIRGIADFDPEYTSSYFLPRETVAPLALLLS
jgi:hypothetical protein